MHYHLEVIMPPTEDVKEELNNILEPFDENSDDEKYRFWDWWVIGGRFSGRKIEAMFDLQKKEEFFEELTRRKITVNALISGKEELNPPEQIRMVDALFNEYFPESPLKVCPFFKHSNDQYKHNFSFPDIMELKDIPQELEASAAIIAGLHYNEKQLEAKFLLQTEMWNGINFVKSEWKGNIQEAIKMYKKQLSYGVPEYIEKHTPKDNWLMVTVDYHS